MRVVSLVPSWTETLLLAGVNVVGRTRFCIHPKGQTSVIPTVGGTKDWDFARILELKPDLLILDKEENPLFMGEQQQIPFYATHVTDVADLPTALLGLKEAVNSPVLEKLAQRWGNVLTAPPLSKWNGQDDLPGLLEWGRKPTKHIQTVLYVIWKDPWMVVSQDTFIGSVLRRLGIEVPLFATKYPEVDLAEYDPETTLLLFSSEPYPFLKKKNDLPDFPYAFVDGESFSWFGSRSLRFLENALKPSPSSLVEGEDYYYDKGLFVFTAKYHLKKGYCCNNNCRHCPYKT